MKKFFVERLTFFAFLFLVLVAMFFFASSEIYATDWRDIFHKVPLDNPYSMWRFVNPPWTAVILYPITLLEEDLGLAVNASLSVIVFSVLVLKRNENVLALALTLTSYPFLALLANGNIEWIPALGFVLANEFGVLLLLTKPQSGILAVFNWLPTTRKKSHAILLILLVSGISFAVWGNWLVLIAENMRAQDMANSGVNLFGVPLFPTSAVIGVAMIFYVYLKRPENNELILAGSTLLLSTYFSPHSVAITFALLAAQHRKTSIIVWLLLWLYPTASNWNTFIQLIF